MNVILVCTIFLLNTCHALHHGRDTPSATLDYSYAKDSTPGRSLPTNCAEILLQGGKDSGIYTIYPKPWFKKHNINVFCDMKTDGGGWIVFQRRDDFEQQQSFIQNWNSYENGFGQLDKDFWLGNENIHILTNQEYVSLRIDLEDFEDDSRFALYNEFRVAGCHNKYRLKIANYSGTAGDSFAFHNNAIFVTFDEDNSSNCSKLWNGGWWYAGCHEANLNGLYLKGDTKLSSAGVTWKLFKGQEYSLKKSEMKIRPAFFSKPLN